MKVVQPIRIRPMVDTDRAFVFQTWLKDYGRAPTPRQMQPEIYNLEQRRVIERLMSTAAVAIACDEDQPNTILGWACGEVWASVVEGALVDTAAVVHYMYVPRHFRERAIGKRLLEHLVGADAIAGKLPLFYSHLPEPRHVDGQRLPNIALTMAKDPRYNPYLAFSHAEDD